MLVNLFPVGMPEEHTHFNVFHKTTDIEYIRPPVVSFQGPTVFMDEYVAFSPDVDNVDCTYKFGLFIEPKSIKPHVYQALYDNPELLNRFDAVFTHDEQLLDISSKTHLFPFLCGSYFLEEDHKIYKKSKGVSIVANSKTFGEGHRFRHEIIKAFGNKIDSYGPWYTDLYKDYENTPTDTLRGEWLKGTGNILRVFKEYSYNIVVHSIRCKNYFDEKLLCCFFSGTVPIIWSPTNVEEFFDPEGFHTFSTLEELEIILDMVGEEDYNSKKSAIERNFQKAQEYISYDKTLAKMIKTYMESNPK